MAKRHAFKACCGSKVLILELSKPIRKPQISFFKDAGYLVPQNFLNSGVFYVQQTGLIATASYGALRIQVRCQGPDCEAKISAFEQLLERAINS